MPSGIDGFTEVKMTRKIIMWWIGYVHTEETTDEGKKLELDRGGIEKENEKTKRPPRSWIKQR